ncbi:MAG: hypothetical protein GYB35_10140 [Algicola sp.]|nr:hypothetical protein [Algicola sp.]
MSLYSYCYPDFSRTRNIKLNLLGFLVFLFIWFLLGLRPISYHFGDMGNYNVAFKLIKAGEDVFYGDLVFDSLIKFCANYLNAEAFFFICFTIYIFPFYFALKRIFKDFWIWPFVLIISLFSFYSFGVNGIRNGMATSLFLLGISFSGFSRWLIFFLSFSIHSSLILPIVGVILFNRFRNINYFFVGWCFCLLVSIFFPGLDGVFSATGLFDEKFTAYSNISTDMDGVGTVGFRLDFVIFSSLPIFIAYFYVYRRRELCSEYLELIAVYLTANAFWLLIIRIPFSNRFAYLSWFLYGVIVAYPLVKSTVVLRYSNRYFSILLSVLYLFSMTLM